VAKVVLENIYKSFASRSRESTPKPTATDALGMSSPKSSPRKSLDHAASKVRSVNVLRSITLSIEDGEFMVLVGPSGCGKSTLLRVIAGLEELTGGNIWVGDRLVNNLPPKERDIAMVFQNYALYPHLNVYDNIAFGLRRMRQKGNAQTPTDETSRPEWVEDMLVGVTRSLPKSLRYRSDKEKTVEKRVRQVSQMLQIEALLERLPKELSGGQKQRVALGRAIARNPQVFLMDEPLSNLDAKLRAETRTQIVQLQRQLGVTTIYVTHDQTEAMTMGDRIAVLNQGEIQQIASPLELYNHPANRFVAEFIGSPPMNFISVEVKAPSLITHPQFRLTLPPHWEKPLQFYDGRSILLGIRPEHLILSPPATKNLQVQVDLVEALGNDTYLSVHLLQEPSTTLQVRIPPDQRIQMGEIIWLSLILDKIHLFDPQSGTAML
jgi:multiple sugar transport system ATP-binding protein